MKIIKVVIAIVVAGVLVAGLWIYHTLYPKAKVTGSGAIKISCVGDSITYGLGVSSHRDQAWASLLPGLLGDDYQTVNYGLSNRTLLSTGDMPYEKEKLAGLFWSGEEDIIIFMLGTNDTKKNNWNADLFETEYRDFVNRLMAKGATVYIMIPPDLFTDVSKSAVPNRDNLVNELIPIIKKVGEETGVNMIDLFSLTEGHSEWFDDGIHPNKEGNEIIAGYIADIIINAR